MTTMLSEFLDDESAESPTRQARANTLHNTIRREFDTPTTSEWIQRRRNSEPRLQLTVAQFFSPQSKQPTGNGIDMNESVSELRQTQTPNSSLGDHVRDEIASDSPLYSPKSPTDMSSWMLEMKAYVLEVPAEGLCFYFALYGAKGDYFRSAKIHIGETNNAGAGYYKHNINMFLDCSVGNM